MEQGVETERKPVEEKDPDNIKLHPFVELIESNILNDNNIEITK